MLEVAIVSCFDSLDRRELQKRLERRVADGALLRLIGKCLHVGGLDGEACSEPERGPTQGAGLSPLLGNVYWHSVLDQWFETEVQPRLQGKATLIRYGDDCAPRAQGRPKGSPERVTVQPMRDGPSESACRSRFQTPSGCCGQKPW
jgi:retron-type reverse transcriptase